MVVSRGTYLYSKWKRSLLLSSNPKDFVGFVHGSHTNSLLFSFFWGGRGGNHSKVREFLIDGPPEGVEWLARIWNLGFLHSLGVPHPTLWERGEDGGPPQEEEDLPLMLSFLYFSSSPSPSPSQPHQGTTQSLSPHPSRQREEQPDPDRRRPPRGTAGS